MQKYKWTRSNAKPKTTHNNDVYWQCPVCKGGGHFFGFDNPDKKDRCPDCGVRLIGYSW